MTLRIGGYAAIAGGLLWFIVLAGNAINDGGESFAPFLGYAVVGATALTLVALVGLSAFQARSHPLLTWSAFAIPAIGAVVGLFGYAAIVVAGDSDAALIAGISPWMIGAIGLLTTVLGSSLFAVATWRTRALSRPASVLLAVGALLAVLAMFGANGALPSPIVIVPIVAAIVMFPVGWMAVGVSALRVTGPAPITLEGASPFGPNAVASFQVHQLHVLWGQSEH